MGFSKNKPKEVYNRKDVFIKHEDIKLLTKVAEMDGMALSVYLEKLVAKDAQKVRKNKNKLQQLQQFKDEQFRKATQSR